MILFGVLFAAFERSDFHKSVVASRYFWHGVVFTSIFNAGVGYAVVYYPDWMWMYFIEDSRRSGSELAYLFAFLYYLPYLLGFYVGFDLKKRSAILWVPFALALAAVEGWLIYRLFDRYSVVGTREEFLNGTAVSLFGPDNPIGPAMNGSVALMIAYYAFVWHRHRKSRKMLLS